jgi:protein-disulfide isomerase
MARAGRGIYTDNSFTGIVAMTDTSATDNASPPRRSPCARALRVTAGLFAAALMAACAGSPPAPDKSPAAADSGGSSHTSGNAYRDTPVRIVQLSTPRVSLGGEPRMGKAEAGIGIVEFSDYECPFCRSFYAQTFPRIKKEYVDTGVVQFIRKDLPLTKIHPQALPAALAANCAGDQGQYWEMHKALYTNQQRLGPALYSDLAGNLGLDEATFSACLKDPAQEQKILRDVAEAKRLNISGTPSFVLGKIEGDTVRVMRVARGAPGFESFAQEIEKLRRQISTDAAPPAK